MWNEIKDHVDAKAKEISAELRNHPERDLQEMKQSGFHPYNLKGELRAYQEMQVFLNQLAELDDPPYAPTLLSEFTGSPVGYHQGCGEVVYRDDAEPHNYSCWKCGELIVVNEKDAVIKKEDC